MAKFCNAALIGFLLLAFAGAAVEAQPYPYPYPYPHWRHGWHYRHRVWAYPYGPYYGYWGPPPYGYWGGRGRYWGPEGKSNEGP